MIGRDSEKGYVCDLIVSSTRRGTEAETVEIKEQHFSKAKMKISSLECVSLCENGDEEFCIIKGSCYNYTLKEITSLKVLL